MNFENSYARMMLYCAIGAAAEYVSNAPTEITLTVPVFVALGLILAYYNQEGEK